MHGNKWAYLFSLRRSGLGSRDQCLVLSFDLERIAREILVAADVLFCRVLADAELDGDIAARVWRCFAGVPYPNLPTRGLELLRLIEAFAAGRAA